MPCLYLNKSNRFEYVEQYISNEYETNLIEYFKEIALKTEYDDNPQKIVKWKKPMSLFIYKENDNLEQIEVLMSTVAKINELASDGFRINIIDDIMKSNSVLYLCSKEKIKEIAPKFYGSMTDEVLGNYTGMSYVEFKWTNFVITKALIFIDEEFSLDEQKHSIIEEVTQCIGLLNDSSKYSDSVFYESIDGIENMNYSKMDEDLLRFLYSDQMIPGYRDETVELVIKRILKYRNTRENE